MKHILSKDKQKAIFFILLADLFIACQITAAKLSIHFFSTSFLVFITIFTNYFLVMFVALSKGEIRNIYKIKGNDKFNVLKNHFIRFLSGFIAFYCYYYPIKYISTSLAMLLFFSFPIFVPFISRIWLKTKISYKIIFGCLIAFIGASIILNPTDKVINILAIIVAITGAFFFSILTIAVRILKKTEDVLTILAYFFTTALFASFIVCFAVGGFPKEIFYEKSLIFIIVIGILGFLYQLSMTNSLKYADHHFISPFMYFVFIFTAIADIFIFKSSVNFIGGILIIIGIITVILFHKKTQA